MIINFIKHIFLSLLTARQFSKKKGIKLFLNIFIIRFFFAFDSIRRLFENKDIDNDNKISSKYFKKDIFSNSILKDLMTKGVNFNLKLKEFFLESIISDISSKNVFINFKGGDGFSKFISKCNDFDGLNEIFKKSLEYKIPHVMLDIDIHKTKAIREFATSSFFVQLAKNYIGKKKISISGQCYISNPIPVTEGQKKDFAQYFHYDNDFKKFFKVFIYLNKVDEASGPHVFIEQTNKKKLFKHLVAERIDDDEILKSYSKEKIKKFLGEKGSIIIEDTFGLHKGFSPKTKSRMMLILIYGEGIGIDSFKNPIFV